MSFLDTVFNFLARGRYYATPQYHESGDLAELQTNRKGHLLVDPYGGSQSSWQDTSAASSERVIKSTSGELFQAVFFNTGATDVFIFLFDHAASGGGRPSDGGVPIFIPVRLPPGGERGISLARPRRFNAGLYWGASSTPDVFTHDSGALVMSAAEYI